MAVDLGWLLWQSIEIQHGADAAALAGVVYAPQRYSQDALARATGLLGIYLLEPSCSYVEYEPADVVLVRDERIGL